MQMAAPPGEVNFAGAQQQLAGLAAAVNAAAAVDAEGEDAEADGDNDGEGSR